MTPTRDIFERIELYIRKEPGPKALQPVNDHRFGYNSYIEAAHEKDGISGEIPQEGFQNK